MLEKNAIAKGDCQTTRANIITGFLIGFCTSIFIYNLVAFFYSIILLIAIGENITVSMVGMTVVLPHLGYILIISTLLMGVFAYGLNKLGINDFRKKVAYISYVLFIAIRLLVELF